MLLPAGKPCKAILFLTLLLLWHGTPLVAEESVVTIESARQTSYYTDEITEDEIVVFSGGVVISVVQGKSTSRIRADQVNFNRSQNLLYASGNVTLDRDTGNGEPEHLTAESLLFNINSEEGIFNSGTVVHSDSGAISVDTESKLVASAELFARDDSGTVAFKSGSLTFCEEPDPHWKINASRIWLLPGNEFAFANALLYVGKVPIAYFPFFYYPKDELIFNPVFGFDLRRGYGIQTTTYLVGRKKPAEKTDDDSFFSFLNSSTMYKQRREGLVLRNLEEKDTGSYPHTLKFMADYYTNLGGMVGVDGVFTPEGGYISRLDFSLSLGFSRSLFLKSQGGVSAYVPYDDQGNIHYNNSYFAGMELPFRYRGHFNLTMTKPFTLNVALPLYSDPFFNKDFLENRKETMDWFDFALSSGSTIEEEDNTSTGEVSSFLWKITASISPQMTASAPSLSSLSFSPGFDLNFYSLTDVSGLSPELAKVSPERKTFYPGLIKPFYFTGTISGDLFTYPIPNRTAGSDGTMTQVSRADLNVPQELMTEEERLKAQAEQDGEEGEPIAQDEEGEASQEENGLEALELPQISVSSATVVPVDGIQYKLSYSVTSDFSSEIGYSTPKTRADFDWHNINSFFWYLRVPLRLSSDLGYRNNFVNLKNGLEFTPTYQRHPIYKDEARRPGIQRDDYIAQKLDLNNTNTLTLSPFVYYPLLSGTNISWNTNLRVIRTNFVGTVEEPEWEYLLPEWNAESFAAHSLTVNLRTQEGKFSQQLSLSSVLPPLRESYNGTLTLGFPYVTTSLGAGLQHKSINDKEWVFQPITQSLTISLLDNKLSITENYQYNLEERYNENLTLRVSGYNLTLAYTMRYVAGYNYNPLRGWVLKQEKEFQPSSLEFTYNATSGKKIYLWKNRISFSPGLNTGIHYNFLQPTSSYLTFAPSITFEINKFLSLTFRSTSRNDVIYRYIQEYTGFEPKIPGETNVLKDLWNSFAFWDEEQRRASGFKLKSLDVILTHELHDWTLSSEFKISPRIVSEGGRNTYDFSPHFTLSVLWKPMSSMKTTIEDKYGTITLNP